MFAETLIIVASACSNGACPPVVASSYQVQVQQPAKEIIYSEWVSTPRPLKFYSLRRRSVPQIQIFNFPSQKVCTKGCK